MKPKTSLVTLFLAALLALTTGLAQAGASLPWRQAIPASLPEGANELYLPLVMKADPAPPAPDWLNYINQLRAVGNLPAVAENATWSLGCYNHSRYMVKNDVISHEETPGNPWYTPEGQAAAQNGNVLVSSNVNNSDQSALDGWMTGPFHGVGMIDPALLQVGYGSYREAIGTWRMGATLDVLRGLGTIPGSVTFPIRWPRDGGVMPYASYDGGEWPDPLSGCAGYTVPSGPPIYLMIGSGNLTPSVTAHSLIYNGAEQQRCVFDETNYTNAGDAYGQSTGRGVLNMRDAIVMMPRNPLVAGGAYTVSITANGQTHTWSFTVSTTPHMLVLPAETLFR
jgi:hypothetical protein